MYVLRVRESDPTVNRVVDSPDSRRLRQRHSEHILDLMRAGISMRTIRRHRLDDPRLTDELRAALVKATKERQSKARFKRSEEQRKEDRLRTLIRLGPGVSRNATTGPDSGCAEAPSHPGMVFVDPLAIPAAIRLIKQHVCEHFYLREMRDSELQLRTHRRTYVLPRQIAMYIARQLTGASLKEIGRVFGNRHHTTTLYSIRNVERIRRSDSALDCAIGQLMNGITFGLVVGILNHT
jgi:hypothetical protein